MGGEDGGSSLSREGGSSWTEKPWEEAWEDEVMVVGEQVASCKVGRHSEQTPGTLVWDHLGGWAREEVESLAGVQGNPVGLEVLEKVGALDTG